MTHQGSICPGFGDFGAQQNHLEDALEYNCWPSPRVSGLVGLSWGQRNCISNTFPGDAERTTLEDLYFRGPPQSVCARQIHSLVRLTVQGKLTPPP